jgi:hypothetical protein
LFLAFYHIYGCAKEILFCSSIIRRDASKNHEGAYIFEEMRPTYQACMNDSVKLNGKTTTGQVRLRLSQV